MSSVSSTPTLASWDPLELLELVNPDKLSITCVGWAPSCQRRCRNTIAQHNIQAAKAVMERMVRPGLSDATLKELFFGLAEYTLCRRYHQGQARQVSGGWFRTVQTHLDEEEERFSDTSDDGSDGNRSSDDDDDSSTGSNDSDVDSNGGDENTTRATNHRNNDGEAELKRRLEELGRLQREFTELLQRQGDALLHGTNRSTAAPLVTPSRQSRATLFYVSENRRSDDSARRQRKEQEARREAEQVRQEDAYRQAQHERAEARDRARREQAERARAEQIRRAEELKREEARRQEQWEEAERKAKAKLERERERLRQQEAERAHLERERQAKECQQQARTSSWESAWLRYEAAWSNLSSDSTKVDVDVRTCEIWPTKSGSYSSCCEEDVKSFFRCQPGSVNRKMLRRQALRWHPDRAVRLFSYVHDEVELGELMAAATMISQVVIGIMAVAAQ